jgi:hypothetical protein
MPYIKRELRNRLDESLLELSSVLTCYSYTNDALCGNLNYCIFKIIKRLIDDDNGGEKSYARFNAIIGALECNKLEVYRRMIAPYEDTKIEQNGDVK